MNFPQDKCPKCGTALARGLCPQCLLQTGMDTIVLGPKGQPRKITPHQEFIADLFPELEDIKAVGRGGMGVVYRAHQRDVKRDIALKLLPLEHADTEGWQARFEVEARAAARLDHPNIVTLYDFGEREGSLYLKMKLVEGGRSLAHALKERSPWPAREAVALLIKIAGAVHHAHQHGIIHRDIKPGNILLDSKGEPYLSDFGLARIVEENAGITRSHMVLGTANYMAPEQADAKNHDLTTAADVYGLGAVLYEMLTGKPPFDGTSVAEILRRVIENEPTTLHALNPAADRDLSTICQKCLEKNPARRYGSAEALAEDLSRWMDGLPIVARRISTVGRLSKWARRKPAVALLTCMVLAMGILAIGLLFKLYSDTKGKLIQALNGFIAEASAHRLSVNARAGCRWEALGAISQAANVLKDAVAVLDKATAASKTTALRNEAIACLALADCRPAEHWYGDPQRGSLYVFDASFTRLACSKAGEGVIQILSHPSGKVLASLSGESNVAGCRLRFSPDGRFLAASYGAAGPLVVWNIETQAPVIRDMTAAGGTFDFSPDGNKVFVGGKNEIAVWSTTTGSVVSRIPLAAEVNLLCCSADGRTLAVAGAQEGVVLLDIESARSTTSFREWGQATALAWHPRSTLLAIASANGKICCWDTAQGAATARKWEAHPDGVQHLAWHPAGRLLASHGADGMIALWETPIGERRVNYAAQPVHDLQFSPDGHRLGLFRQSDQLSLLEVEDGALKDGPIVRHSVGHEGRQVSGASWHPAHGVLASAGDDAVKFWSPAGDQIGSLEVKHIRSALWTADSFIVSGQDGIDRWQISVVSTPDGARRLKLGQRSVIDSRPGWERASLSSDGALLAVTHPDRILLVDLSGKNPPRSLTGQKGAAFASISPDNRWLATGTWHQDNVRLWSLPDGKPGPELKVEGSANVLFSPNGESLVTAGSNEYRIWPTDSWKNPAPVPTMLGDYFGAMAFSPRMTALAIESEHNRIKIIHPPTLMDLAAPDFDRQSPLAFSPDGAILVNVDAKKHLVFWNLARLREGMKSINLDWKLPPIEESKLAPAVAVEVEP